MRFVLAPAVALLFLLLLPGTGTGQTACPAPGVESFVLTKAGDDADGSGAAGQPHPVEVAVSNALRVEIAWGDGTRSASRVKRDVAASAHTYAAAGTYPIDVVAVGSCGGVESRSPVGRLTVVIGPPCEERRGAGLTMSQCDAVRGALRVSTRSGGVDGALLYPPCRDNFSIERVEPERPVARAASCAGNAGPPGVSGTIEGRVGTAVTLSLGAPAGAVRVLAGNLERGTRRLPRPRQLDAAGRVFRLRLPRLPRGTRRLFVRAHGDDWVVGLRVR